MKRRADQSRQRLDVAALQFTRYDGVFEQRLISGVIRIEVLEGPLAELRIRELELQKRQVVGQHFGSFGHLGHLTEAGKERFERGPVGGTDHIETGTRALGRHLTDREQQAAFGPKSLDQRRRSKPGFFGDMGQGEVCGTFSPKHARSGFQYGAASVALDAAR